MCRVSLVPILKPFWRCLVKLFETISCFSFQKNGKVDHSIDRWPDVTPQIAQSSKGSVLSRNKISSSIAPNKFHSMHTRVLWRSKDSSRTKNLISNTCARHLHFTSDLKSSCIANFSEKEKEVHLARFGTIALTMRSVCLSIGKTPTYKWVSWRQRAYSTTLHQNNKGMMITSAFLWVHK